MTEQTEKMVEEILDLLTYKPPKYLQCFKIAVVICIVAAIVNSLLPSF